jgi:hypothetical protein
MKRLFHATIAGLAIGLLAPSCSDRPVGDPDDPPDIEGLCKEYCTRVMECVWNPDSSVAFNTVEGCRHNCETDIVWNKCPSELDVMYACFTQFDCPEFAEIWTEHPDGPCGAEITAFSTCIP